jgi:hypothetical protein
MAPINPARAAPGSRSAIPPAPPCSGSAVTYGIDEPRAERADDDAPQRRNHACCWFASWNRSRRPDAVPRLRMAKDDEPIRPMTLGSMRLAMVWNITVRFSIICDISFALWPGGECRTKGFWHLPESVETAPRKSSLEPRPSKTRTLGKGCAESLRATSNWLSGSKERRGGARSVNPVSGCPRHRFCDVCVA